MDHPAIAWLIELDDDSGYLNARVLEAMGFECDVVQALEPWPFCDETEEWKQYNDDPATFMEQWRPEGNGILASKWDTEDGPKAMFVRPTTDWAREILALGDAHLQFGRSDLFSAMADAGAVKRFVNNSKRLQDSGNTEWYTPAYIVEAARRVMGGIDLDPASSPKANKVVQATTFYTAADDGLSKPWRGRVWMNHPYSREGNPLWIARLVEEYRAGNVTEACCICYAAVSAKWFRPLFDFPRWIPPKRINYIDPATGQPVKGVQKDSTVTYLGPNLDRFIEEFQNTLGGRTDMPADTKTWQQVVVGYENGRALTERVQDWAR